VHAAAALDALYKKEYLARKDSSQKPSADAARDDGAQRAFDFHPLNSDFKQSG
jgi:hypothetical protein